MLLTRVPLPRGISRVVPCSPQLKARRGDLSGQSGASTRLTGARGVHVSEGAKWHSLGSSLPTRRKWGPPTAHSPAGSCLFRAMSSGFLSRSGFLNNSVLSPGSDRAASSILEMPMGRACASANPVRVGVLPQKETSRRTRCALNAASAGLMVGTHGPDRYASASSFAAPPTDIATHSCSFSAISHLSDKSTDLAATSLTLSSVPQRPDRASFVASFVGGTASSVSSASATSTAEGLKTLEDGTVGLNTAEGLKTLKDGTVGGAPPPPHIPVLLDQVLECFRGRELKTYIDGTLGAGGHTCAIMREHPELTRVLGLDVDPTAHAIAASRLMDEFPGRVRLIGDELALSKTSMARGAWNTEGRSGNRSMESCSSSDASQGSSVGSPPSNPAPEDASPGSFPSNDAPDGATLGSSLSLEVSTSSSGIRTHSGNEGPQTSGWHTTVHLRYSNFRNIESAALLSGISPGTADGILLDIGVSSMQIDSAERGFSFKRDGPLDMRMDPQHGLTAEFIVNEWPEDQLGAMLRDLGEERNWRQLAKRIVDARRMQRIESTQQLTDILSGGRPSSQRHSSSRHRGKVCLHPATRSFQALRIAVNAELDSLAQAIPAAAAQLAPGGRLAVISFHSLEDRIVKHTFLELSGKPREEGMQNWGVLTVPLYGGTVGPKVPGEYKVVTRKPLEAREEEAAKNPRSRSAKLRILERVK